VNKISSDYKTLSRLVYLAAGLFVAIWFAHAIIPVILLLFFAIVITIVLNAPVTWLQRKKFSRTVASLIVFLGMLAVFGLLGWMLIPKIVSQVKLLVTDLPNYLDKLNQRVSEWMGEHAADNGKPPSATPITDQLPNLVNNIGQYSLGLISNIFTVIFFFCLVGYMLINPRPLLAMYLAMFPEDKKEKAAEAFANASTMTIGWMWSNVMAGALRAVLVWIFLYYMGIPGVWVWAGITFFAELIPKIGFYIMAVPPILLAFTISPVTALYVIAFMLILDEIIGDFILPRLRSKTMKIHPVSTLVVLLAMTAAFGIMGAFIATPLVAFIKAYYEAFYQKQADEKTTDKQVDQMLFRK
jgi:putative permease